MRKQLMMAVIDRLGLLQLNENSEYFVAETLDPNKAAIRHFDIWNQNLDYIDDEPAFLLPAVFIEFEPIMWRQQSQGQRDATVAIRLHLITQFWLAGKPKNLHGDNALAQLDLLDGINLCMHGFKGQNFGAFSGIKSETDHNFDELMHNIETYTTMAIDTSAVKTQQRAPGVVVIDKLL